MKKNIVLLWVLSMILWLAWCQEQNYDIQKIIEKVQICEVDSDCTVMYDIAHTGCCSSWKIAINKNFLQHTQEIKSYYEIKSSEFDYATSGCANVKCTVFWENPNSKCFENRCVLIYGK